MNAVLSWLEPFGPSFLALIVSVAVIAVSSRALERRRIRAGKPKVVSQLTTFGLAIVSLVAVILALPVGDTTQGQLLSFLGILISASIALSSGNIVGNAMAGMMLRVGVSKIDLGDTVEVEGLEGRVTELGILNTHIQTRSRDMIWLPNQWLIGRPARLIQKSGTYISETVSLAYEVPAHRVEPLLLAAADDAGLEATFANVAQLGDAWVEYRTGGLLRDIEYLYATRAQLRRAILDRLQAEGIEIVAPQVVNLRTFGEERSFLPDSIRPAGPAKVSGTIPEDVVFDHAKAAGRRARERREILEELEQARTELAKIKAPAEAADVVRRVSELESRLRELDPEGGE